MPRSFGLFFEPDFMKQTNHTQLRIIVLLLSLTALPSARPQVIPDVLPAVRQAAERQAEQARERAAERAQERAAERAQERAANIQNQAVERAQNAAAEQAAGQAVNQVDRAQSQAAERARERAEARADRVRDRADRAQQRMERLPEPAAEAQQRIIERLQTQEVPARAPQDASSQPGLPPQAQGNPRFQRPENNGRPANPISLLPPLPERLEVTDQSGEAAFVDISIAPNIRVLEREWVMLVNQEQRVQLEADASDVMRFLVREDDLSSVNRSVLTFRVPPDLDANDAVLDLLPENLRPFMDRNHVYQAQSGPERPAEKDTSALSIPMSSICEDPVSVGVIDSQIDLSHPAFQYRGARQAIVQQSFIDAEIASPLSHGTAVAGVLIGQGKDLRPVLPGADVYSAAVVYAQDDYRQAASAASIVRAVDWLLGQPVTVINISLTGPANRLLEQSMLTARERGIVLIAAAGNNGPFADPLYPAAYPQVVAVTAVSRDKTVYRWANQGQHIDFSALGVALPTAGRGGDIAYESGTSLAAPIVTAFAACQLFRTAGDVDRALAGLRAMAEDLGDEGRDPVYGDGLLHP